MEDVKVTEEEFKLVSQIRNLKEKGFTTDDILQLNRNKEISKENIQKARKETISGNTRRIKHYNRSIVHKREQVATGGLKEKHEGYIDDKKPVFMLENEIEEIEANIVQMNEINKLAQEEYDREEKKLVPKA